MRRQVSKKWWLRTFRQPGGSHSRSNSCHKSGKEEEEERSKRYFGDRTTTTTTDRVRAWTRTKEEDVFTRPFFEGPFVVPSLCMTVSCVSSALHNTTLVPCRVRPTPIHTSSCLSLRESKYTAADLSGFFLRAARSSFRAPFSSVPLLHSSLCLLPF